MNATRQGFMSPNQKLQTPVQRNQNQFNTTGGASVFGGPGMMSPSEISTDQQVKESMLQRAQHDKNIQKILMQN